MTLLKATSPGLAHLTAAAVLALGVAPAVADIMLPAPEESGALSGGLAGGDEGGDLVGRGIDLHVAVLELTLVVGLAQHGADESDDAFFMRENACHVGSALHLLVEALAEERHVGQNVRLGFVSPMTGGLRLAMRALRVLDLLGVVQPNERLSCQ